MKASSLTCICFVFLLLCSLVGCSRTARFYRRPRIASFYTQSYCFEVPSQKVRRLVQTLLKKQRFELIKPTPPFAFQTKAVYIPHFSHNRNYGYEVAMQIELAPSQGLIPRKGIPMWSLRGKTPPAEPPPQQGNYPSYNAYVKALTNWQKSFEKKNKDFQRGIALMKRWQGCDIFRAKKRTRVLVKATITAYPYGVFNTLKRAKGRKVPSDKTFEYSFLRYLGYYLGKLKHMPRLIY